MVNPSSTNNLFTLLLYYHHGALDFQFTAFADDFGKKAIRGDFPHLRLENFSLSVEIGRID